MGSISFNEQSQPLQPQQGRTGRIEYIDALRGFTMILVVLVHVEYFCLGISNHSTSVYKYVNEVMLPLFFFISGFVLYKAGVVWDWNHIKAFFRRRIPALLISPLIFMAIYIYISGDSMIEGLGDPAKRGYWFTLVLLEFYVFYSAIRFFIRKRWANIALVILGLLIYIPLNFILPIPEYTSGFLCIVQWKYFIFFVIGSLLNEYFSSVQKYLDGKWLIPVCVLFFFLMNVFINVLPNNFLLNQFINFWITFSGLVLIFSFFRKNQVHFTQDTVLGRSLQYIGRHTLDVYFLHFFLLPKSLGITYFAEHPVPVIELAVSLTIAILIIGASLIISNVIRLSPILAHWLFGAKYPSK